MFREHQGHNFKCECYEERGFRKARRAGQPCHQEKSQDGEKVGCVIVLKLCFKFY